MSHSHEGEGGDSVVPDMNMGHGGFDNLGDAEGNLEVEGVSSLQATKLNYTNLVPTRAEDAF